MALKSGNGEAGAAREGDGMTHHDTHSPAVDFLIRLRKMDKRGLSARDVLLLYTIIANPGIHGQDAVNKIGGVNRSGIQHCLMRLIREGLIEDRRLEARRAQPNRLYALPAGVEFWNDLKP